MAKREYNQKLNVYDAANERLAFIFENFERVYLSFSGGKDSGCLLNLVLDFMKKHGIKRKLGIQIMDNEANYEMSVQFMHDMIRQNRDMLDVTGAVCPLTCPAPFHRLTWIGGVGERPKKTNGFAPCRTMTIS